MRALTATQPCSELDIKDKYKMLPLHLACEGGDKEIVALLLARGARVLTTPASPTRPAPAPAEEDAAAVAASETAAAAAAVVTDDAVAGAGAEAAGGGGASLLPTRQPNFGGSPVPKRKQLIAMQKSEIGGSAYFIAKSHNHTDVVGLLERAASGESIPMPVLLSERSTASSVGG